MQLYYNTGTKNTTNYIVTASSCNSSTNPNKTKTTFGKPQSYVMLDKGELEFLFHF